MSSRGVIDLRPRGGGRKPSAGQQPLFSPPRRGDTSAPKRPMPLRARRRRVRAGIAFGILVVLAALAWGVSYISYLPQFSIQSITVTGSGEVSPQLVQDYVGTILNDGSYHFLSRSDIFLYPRALIEKGIVADFPRIDSAKVSRPSLFSTTLVVAVTERQQFALWCDVAAQCYSMDEGGFIFAQAPTGAASSSVYIFRGGIGTDSTSSLQASTTNPQMNPQMNPQINPQMNPIGQRFAAAHLPGITTLLSSLGQSGFTPQGATVENDEDFSVPLAQGFLLKASFGESPDILVKNLQLVLSSDALQDKESQLEYVDLRFGDRVYYKLQGQEEATGAAQ